MVDRYTTVASEATTFLTGILIASAVASFAIYIILSVSWYTLFKRSGEKGYKAWIPIYNSYILMRIVGLNPWTVLLYFIPIVNIFALALLSVRVANTYEKGAGFALGVLFFPFVCYPILAFGNQESKPEESKMVLADENSIICPNCMTNLAVDATSCFICGEPVAISKKEEVETLNLTEETVAPVPSFLHVPEQVKEETVEPNYEEHLLFTEEMDHDPVMIQDGVLHFTPDENFSVDETDLSEEHSFDFEKIVNEYNETSTEEANTVKPKLEDMLQVENTYDVEREGSTSPKYRSSSKTLDEILRINSDLYAEMETKKEQQEAVDPLIIPSKNTEESSLEEAIKSITANKMDQTVPLPVINKMIEIEDIEEPFSWEDQHIETLASEEDAISEEETMIEEEKENRLAEEDSKEEVDAIEDSILKIEIPSTENDIEEPTIEEYNHETVENIPYENGIENEPEIETNKISTEMDEKESFKEEKDSKVEEMEMPRVFRSDKLPDDTTESKKEQAKEETFSLENEINSFIKELEDLHLDTSVEEPKKESTLTVDDFKEASNHDTLEEGNIEIHDQEAIDLLNKIKEVNRQVKEDAKKEQKNSTFGAVKVCGSCGSTIPRYSTRCLLCGATVEEEEKVTM